MKYPDLDNVVKFVLDALEGLAYVNDKQISMLSAEKRYRTCPGPGRTSMRIAPIEEVLVIGD